MIEKLCKNPLILSLIFGVSAVLLAIVSFFGISIMAMILDKGHSAGGVLGFVVMPIYMFAGYPWSFGTFQLGGVYDIVVGIFINSASLGLIIGVISWFMRNFRNQKIDQ